MENKSIMNAPMTHALLLYLHVDAPVCVCVCMCVCLRTPVCVFEGVPFVFRVRQCILCRPEDT